MAYQFLETIFLHALCELLLSIFFFFCRSYWPYIIPTKPLISVLLIQNQNYNNTFEYPNNREGSILHPLKDSEVVRPDLQLDTVTYLQTYSFIYYKLILLYNCGWTELSLTRKWTGSLSTLSFNHNIWQPLWQLFVPPPSCIAL